MKNKINLFDLFIGNMRELYQIVKTVFNQFAKPT
jgi:hypothetical protein